MVKFTCLLEMVSNNEHEQKISEIRELKRSILWRLVQLNTEKPQSH